MITLLNLCFHLTNNYQFIMTLHSLPNSAGPCRISKRIIPLQLKCKKQKTKAQHSQPRVDILNANGKATAYSLGIVPDGQRCWN